MQNYPAAEKYLTELAGMDFGYKDVGDLLDKLNRAREDDGPAGTGVGPSPILWMATKHP